MRDLASEGPDGAVKAPHRQCFLTLQQGSWTRRPRALQLVRPPACLRRQCQCQVLAAGEPEADAPKRPAEAHVPRWGELNVSREKIRGAQVTIGLALTIQGVWMVSEWGVSSTRLPASC